MSGQTLEVDSSAIRQAAEVVTQAAAAFDASGSPDPSPLAIGDLGPSAAAQSAIAAAARGLARAQTATGGLAERSRAMAGAMVATAAMFDVVDSVIGAVR